MNGKLVKKDLLRCKSFLIALLILGLLPFSLFAQENSISGKVLDETGLPLPGVNITQKGTSNGASSDFDGKFFLNLKSGNKTLVFSYLGFKTKEVNVDTTNDITVVLEEDIAGLEEVVVIGFANVEREKILGAVSSVKSESLEQAAPVDALQGIQGKVSGVQIISNNGPGEGFDVRIRGVGTLNGATGPLYVVDGQQLFDIDNLDPNDVESLEVLKDGASTAAYGAQGANGVVVITTKGGKSGGFSVGVTTTTGVNTLVGAIPVANARQRLIVERQQNSNGQNIRDSLSLLLRNSPDIQDLVTRPALRTQTNVALTSGNDKSKFYWNTGFLSEEGIIVNSGFKRVNTRMKIDMNPSTKFSVGTVANMSFEETNGAPSFAVLNQLTRRIPFLPIFEPNGEFTPSTPRFASANPLQQAVLQVNKRKNYRFNVFNYAEYKILPQLSIKSTLGATMAYDKREFFSPSILDNTDFRNGFATARESHFLSYNIQQDNFLNFDQTWGKHNLTAFGGMQLQTGTNENLGLTSRLANDLIPTLNNANPEFFLPTNQTENLKRGQFSLFTGFNYDFANKYLIGATIRRDGSSRFGPKNQFGYFPSASLGWRVNKEGFLKNVKSINNLLIRASYGIVGNDRINEFQFLSSLEPNAIYNNEVGFIPVVLGNELIKWEETESTNLGLDLSMFKRKLNISLDVWRRDTNDLLVSSQLPEESGFSTIRENRGVIRNQGLDFSIDGTLIKKKDFSWKASFNVGILENEVVELNTPIISGRFKVEEGGPIGNIVGFKQNGVFQYDESNAFTQTGERLFPDFDDNNIFLGTYTRANGEAFPVAENSQIRSLVHGASGNVLRGGDYIWDDSNNDGIIDDEDIQVLGNGLPTVFGGLTQDFKYKNFTLGLLFDYSFGNDIYRRYDHERNSIRASVLTPSPDRIEQAWANQGDLAIYPILATAAQRPQNRFDFRDDTANSFYVTDGAFVKWRYLRLGYTIPQKTVDFFNIGLKSLSLNLQANNLLTWTNYEGYNPEFGTRGNPLEPSEDNLRYPNDRELLLTLKVQF